MRVAGNDIRGAKARPLLLRCAEQQCGAGQKLSRRPCRGKLWVAGGAKLSVQPTCKGVAQVSSVAWHIDHSPAKFPCLAWPVMQVQGHVTLPLTLQPVPYLNW